MLPALNAGDCGSWVVDPSTCEVYGHVVASDAMGDSYIVPLSATLRDMEKKLGADTVSLPTEADIHTWLAQHVKAAEVAARSKARNLAFNDIKTHRTKFPRDFLNLAERLTSQVSTSPALSAIKTSTPIVDYCNSCNETFEGTSQDFRSNLQRHLRTCSRQNKDVAPDIESFISQDARDTSDEQLKKSTAKYSKDVQQKSTDNTSTQQTSPVPWSIRSMYSSFRKKLGGDSQQKDGDEGTSISNSKDSKTVRFTKALKNKKKKKYKSKKGSTSPPISSGVSALSSALAGRISGDLPRAQLASPVISRYKPMTPPLPTRPVSLRFSTTPPPGPARPLLHGHESFHGSSFDPRRLSCNSDSGQNSYEGYTLDNYDSGQTGPERDMSRCQDGSYTGLPRRSQESGSEKKDTEALLRLRRKQRRENEELQKKASRYPYSRTDQDTVITAMNMCLSPSS